MFGKKIITLAVWYVAWSVVASLFNNKKWANFKKELAKAKEEGKDTKMMVLDNFIDTQKKFAQTLKKEILTEENIEYLKWKKQDIESLVDDYKLEWEKLLDELKGKGEDYLDTAKVKLEDLYNEKIEEISNLKWDAPEKLEELKNMLLKMLEDMKKSLIKSSKTIKTKAKAKIKK